MSPLWRDEVGVFLSPRCVVLNRMQRGLRPRCVASDCFGVEGGSFSNWAPTIDVLQSCLEAPIWQGANARVVLADAWVRYAMVPPVSGVNGTAERAAHARAVMAQTFGEMDSGWRLALSQPHSGAFALACATPDALLDVAGAIMDSAKLKVITLQPQLAVAFNFWRSALPADCNWFVSLDAGSLAAARLTPQGGWDQVRCVRIGSDWATELRRLQTFGRLASSGTTGGTVCIDAPIGLRALLRAPAEGLVMLDHDAQPGYDTLTRLVALKGLNL